MANSTNLTQEIVESLGLKIIRGDYNNKIFPTEAILSKEFSASRTVIREAVKMLTAKSLLSSRPKQGTKIQPEKNWSLIDPDVLRWMLKRKFSLDLLLDYTEVRYAIEPMAAYYAAKRATKANLDDIKKALQRMEDANNNLDDPLEPDIEFHLSILNASQNRFYIQFSGLISSALATSIRFTNKTKGVQVANIKDHTEIYNHIVNKEPEKAKDEMSRLIKEVKLLIIETKQKQANK